MSMREIGVDLHKTNFQVCYHNSGDVDYSRYELSKLEKFKARLQLTDQLAVKSTGNSRWFVEQIRNCVQEVVVVNPKQFKVVSESSKKTDKADAELLAFYLH